METPQVVLLVFVVLFTLLAAAWDARSKRIPKFLTVGAFLLAIVYHIVFGALEGGLVGVGSHLLTAAGGFATGFGILFVVWLVGGGGGGDVKLMGALGTWLGVWMTFQVFILSAVLIGMATIGILVWHMCTAGFGKTRRRFLSGKKEAPKGSSRANREKFEREQKTRRRLMPYGVPVALATWVVLAVMIITEMNSGN